jgi:hypothetical protein
VGKPAALVLLLVPAAAGAVDAWLIRGWAAANWLSDGAEPVQDPFEWGQVGTVASVGRPVDYDQVLVGHVPDQDGDDAQGRVEVGGDSAMDRMSWQRAAMARCSTVSFGVSSPVEVVETSVSIFRSSWVGRVRPGVMA